MRWLVDHHLLVAVADDMVELPREVGLVLRRDTGPLGHLHPDPPELDAPVRPGADSAGAGQALEAVRHLDALLQALAENPAAGAAHVRARHSRPAPPGPRCRHRRGRRGAAAGDRLRRRAARLHRAGEPRHRCAPAGPAEMLWLPAPAYDTWRGAELAERWALLARTWLDMSRAPSLIGQRDEKDRPISALSTEVDRATAAAARRSVLERAGRYAARHGRRSGRGAGPAGLALAPAGRCGTAGQQALTRAVLIEAATLGVTGLDALTTYGRVLLAERRRSADDDPLGVRAGADRGGDELVAALDALLPAPVDHMLVQADLTVVVPGPPEAALAAELAAVADAESRGGATVYRVTPASIRRALDTGYSAADVHQLCSGAGPARRCRRRLSISSTTWLAGTAACGSARRGVPAQRRRGAAGRGLADRRLAVLALRRLAPTVLATPYAPARLLDALRDAGYAPVPEDAAGATVLTRPKAVRAPARPTPRSVRGRATSSRPA